MSHLARSTLKSAKSLYDYAHPERFFKGDWTPILTWEDSIKDYNEREKRGETNRINRDNEHLELCHSCGWTAYDETMSCYASRIKIFHTNHSNGALWSIGSEWIIRDQPNDATVGCDYITQQFLRAQPGITIPLVKEMRSLSARTDEIYLTLMSRSQGERLLDVVDSLSMEETRQYKDQLVNILRQLRQFTAPGAQKVDGSPLHDTILGFCDSRRVPTCKKIGYTMDEWFDNIGDELRAGLSHWPGTDDPAMMEAKFQELKDRFPKPEPYTLTHADLNFSNIMVKDGRIDAIIDWEFSGYYPWWVERLEYGPALTFPDGETSEQMWVELTGMDNETFLKTVIEPVEEIRKIWALGQNTVDHGELDQLEVRRPAFCQCKPFWGVFKPKSLGISREHTLRENGWRRACF